MTALFLGLAWLTVALSLGGILCSSSKTVDYSVFRLDIMKNYTGMAGEFAVFQCDIIPENCAAFGWKHLGEIAFRHGQLQHDPAKYGAFSHLNLYTFLISNLSHEDQGRVECFVDCGRGTEDWRELQAFLTVIGSSSKTADDSVFRPGIMKNFTGMTGDFAVFQCDIIPKNCAAFGWKHLGEMTFFQGQLQHDATKYAAFSHHNFHTFVISNLSHGDQGRVECFVDCGRGTEDYRELRAFLSVIDSEQRPSSRHVTIKGASARGNQINAAKAFFRSGVLQNQTGTVGSFAIFRCEIAADYCPLEYGWLYQHWPLFINGKKYQTRDKGKLKFRSYKNGNHLSLLIIELNHEDEGRVECVSKCEHEDVWHKIPVYLTVLDDPTTTTPRPPTTTADIQVDATNTAAAKVTMNDLTTTTSTTTSTTSTTLIRTIADILVTAVNAGTAKVIGNRPPAVTTMSDSINSTSVAIVASPSGTSSALASAQGQEKNVHFFMSLASLAAHGLALVLLLLMYCLLIRLCKNRGRNRPSQPSTYSVPLGRMTL